MEKNLTREDLKKAFIEMKNKYGDPKQGNVYCIEQLISEVCHVFLCYDKAYITYEFGGWNIGSGFGITSKYAEDHHFFGAASAKEWFTPEQIRALHEVGFGYQF